MRVVFIGTPEIAVPLLQSLLDTSYSVCGVFTQPDRPSGRGHKLHPTPVKILAQTYGIPVYQPEKIRKEENRPVLEELRPDFIVVAAYGQILPGWLLRLASFPPVNVHFSLLPRYRGAAPVAWSILNGDTITGVTTMIMQETLDSGPILLQQETSIPLESTAGEISSILSEIGAELLIKTLVGLKEDKISPIVQDESKVSWAPRLTRESAVISWDRKALEIHNQVRALNPWPIASTHFMGEPLHIWRSLPESRESDTFASPGTVVGIAQDGLLVQCGDRTVLNILDLQRPAKSRISGRAFANGARLHIGDRIFGPNSESPARDS
jgi:methionyl-tRNA formyltransferase